MNLKFNKSLIKKLFPSILACGIGGLLISCSVHDNKRSPASTLIKEININQNQNSTDNIGNVSLCTPESCEVAGFTKEKIFETGNNNYPLRDNLDEENNSKSISFRELIQCLPKSPRGWTTEKPYGQTSSFGDNTISQVKQKYFQHEKAITVSIFDWKFNSALFIPFLISTEFSQESTEGYNKGIKIDNIPGRINYEYFSKQGGLNLLINSRFFVKISGVNIEEEELIEWWNLLDYQSLLKIK